jgi:hypothetical protein
VGDFEELLTQIRTGPEPEPCTNYDKFLQALLEGRHPPFCELIWTGEAYHISLQLHFQKAPEVVPRPGPEGQVYRREAYRRFKRIKPAEQRLVAIRVQIKNWLPVTADVTIRPEAAGVLRLTTDRLFQFADP